MAYENARSEAVAVNNASTRVSEPKARSILYLFNSSTAGQTVTVVLAPKPAEALGGIVLLPNTGYMESRSEGFEVYAGAINAISSAAAGQLSIMER